MYQPRAKSKCGVETIHCEPARIKITKEDIGLGNVDNTSDADKPISDAMRDIVSRMEDAVTNANNASESAEISAGIVAGYNARLTEVENGYITKNGTDIPQVVSGTGGLQTAGDMDVGGDFSVMGDTTLGDQMEVAGMSIERDGETTVISNDDGISINGIKKLGLKNLSRERDNPPSSYVASSIIEFYDRFDNLLSSESYVTENNAAKKQTKVYGVGGKYYSVNQTINNTGDSSIQSVHQNSDGTLQYFTFLKASDDGFRMYTNVPVDDTNSHITVNKAFVQDSTENKPNNLIHNIGDETINGIKTFETAPTFTKGARLQYASLTTNTTGWFRMYYSNTTLPVSATILINCRGMDGYATNLNGLVMITSRVSATAYTQFALVTKELGARTTSYSISTQLAFCVRDGVMEIWFKKTHSDRDRVYMQMLQNYGFYFNVDGETRMTTTEFDATEFTYKKMCVVE